MPDALAWRIETDLRQIEREGKEHADKDTVPVDGTLSDCSGQEDCTVRKVAEGMCGHSSRTCTAWCTDINAVLTSRVKSVQRHSCKGKHLSST